MGTMKAIVGIVAIVAAVYLCATLIPPFFSNYQFEDAIKTEAQMSTYSTKSEEQIRDTIYKKAQELEIPMNREQIKVQRVGPDVTVTIDYVVHVDLLVHPIDLRFHVGSKNKAI